MSKTLLTILFVCTMTSLCAQDALDIDCGCSGQEMSLEQYFNKTESNSSLRFFYLQEWIEPFKITQELNTANKTLRETLNELFRNSDLNYVFMYNYAVILYKDPAGAKKRDDIIYNAVKNKVTIDSLVIGNPKLFKPGARVTFKGVLKDKLTKNILSEASVQVSDLSIGSSTDASGRFQFSLPSGDHVITFRTVGYDERILKLSIYASGDAVILLDESPITLEEVVVTDRATINTQLNQITLKMTDLKRMPSFLGEVDVIKQVQTQTGVTTASEASSGFNVRGGGVDQNLILYDGVPVFNTSHALGFFTAFNSEAIGDATFYKGGIPSEYGGRISSVLSMTSKEGDYKKWKGVAGIGAVSANVMVSGPIKKDTSSVIASFRTTYSDWILSLLESKYKDIKNSSVFFYDGSLKLTRRISNVSKITFSAYTSSDKFSLASDTINSWRNVAVALKYDHRLTDKLYYRVGAYVGHYSYMVDYNKPPAGFNLKYQILFPSLKLDFNNDGLFHKRAFGLHTTFYSFSPGDYQPKSAENLPVHMTKENSTETAIYFNDSFFLGDKLNIEAGLRLSMYNRFGPGKLYSYKPDAPFEVKNKIDSIQYSSGKIMKSYGGPEPRLSLKYALNLQSSLKLGYNRMYQYVHLISNTATVTPVDIWQSSNAYFKPQLADQISLGYFSNEKNNHFEGFIELYYKYTRNILDFKDGANLILNPELETALLRGVGKSYGVEFSITKKTGRLIGGVNYTYSRSLRKVNGVFESEKINKGQYYPSNYDQPNILNINGRYSLSKRLFLSGTFTYHTGRPVSLPVAGYMINNNPVTDFSERNNFRIPDYHRLDLALVIEGSHRKKKLVEGHWTLSIYNIYGRKNPYSVFFVYKGGGVLKPYKLSLIGTAVPSISYTIRF